MKTQGAGFKYQLDGKEIKNFDDFQRKLEDIEVTIEVDKLIVKAKTVK